MTLTVVPVSLDQVAGSRARARANQGTFLSADQCASKHSCRSSDKRSLSSAVVNAVVITS